MIMTRISKKLTVILFFVLLIAMPCDTASAASYNLYGNARFGYSIKYPSFLSAANLCRKMGTALLWQEKKQNFLCGADIM